MKHRLKLNNWQVFITHDADFQKFYMHYSNPFKAWGTKIDVTQAVKLWMCIEGKRYDWFEYIAN